LIQFLFASFKKHSISKSTKTNLPTNIYQPHWDQSVPRDFVSDWASIHTGHITSSSHLTSSQFSDNPSDNLANMKSTCPRCKDLDIAKHCIHHYSVTAIKDAASPLADDWLLLKVYFTIFFHSSKCWYDFIFGDRNQIHLLQMYTTLTTYVEMMQPRHCTFNKFWKW